MSNLNMNSCATIPLEQWREVPKNIQANSPSQYRFCITERPVESNYNYVSPHQPFRSAANPKTKLPVYIIPPSFATDYWSSNTCVPSGINRKTHQELYNNGYVGLNQCASKSFPLYSDVKNQYKKPVLPPINLDPTPIQTNPEQIIDQQTGLPIMTEPSFPMEATEKTKQQPEISTPATQQIIEPINFSSLTQYPSEKEQDEEYCPPMNTGILSFDSYDENKLRYNIPVNLPAGYCQQNDKQAEYNKLLFTQPIEPSVYYNTEVIEPINQMIGVSFNPEFEPMTRATDGDSTMFTVHDPVSFNSPVYDEPVKVEPTLFNTYDPRTFGYGTSYRYYFDTMTGQPRFYYDDIDAVRREKYIVRSNIDHISSLNQHNGFKQSDDLEPASIPYQQVDQQFHDSTISHRQGIQASLMRKQSNITWQRRIAPIRR